MKLPKSSLSVQYHNLSNAELRVLEVPDSTFEMFTAKNSLAKFRN